MNKLVMLNEVRKEKKENNYQSKENDDKPIKDLYTLFKDKFYNLDSKEIDEDLKLKTKKIYNQKKLNNSFKKIFLLENKTLLIDFINSVYSDCLSRNSKIKYISNDEISYKDEKYFLKDASYSIIIQAVDDYRHFEYNIQFQTNDEKNIAFSILKKDLNLNYNKVLNLNQKREEYGEKNKKEEKSPIILVMINSDIEVPDSYEINNSEQSYKINILKSWKYDFKKLIEEERYLLFPFKVFDLKKRLSALINNQCSTSVIKQEIVLFFKDMNRYLEKIKNKGLIDKKGIDEINLIAMDLLNDYAYEELNVNK